MKTKLLLSAVITASMVVPAAAQNQTGRQLDIFGAPQGSEIVPSENNGIFTRVPVVGIFWDERCASVEYTFNTNQPANPGTANEIDTATLASIVQTGLDRWNDNPSSYIEMNVVNQTDLGNRPRIGGDFINEVTFITAPGFGALASSPSTSLTADALFVAGDDIDDDGDSDVFDPAVEGINVCSDVDGDGDHEFPAGFYKAGTILDNDVQFSSTVIWETTPTAGGGADIDAVSTHEFGHSHGLSHSSINQISATDGTTSTMFPFISTNIANAEFGTRTLHTDDLAASANIYREGQGTTPISAIQAGDVPFSNAYSLIEGNVLDRDDFPLSGAAVSATNVATGEVEAVTYAGEIVLFDDNGGLFISPESIRNADYSLAVPSGASYEMNITAMDGTPVDASRISNITNLSSILGLTNFPSEAFNIGDTTVEILSQTGTNVTASPFGVSGVNFVENVETTLEVIDGFASVISGAIIPATNRITYINQFDRDDVLARLAQGDALVGGSVFPSLFQDADETYTFSGFFLGTASVDANGMFTNANILRAVGPVLAEDGNDTLFDFDQPARLRFDIRNALDADPNAQLILAADIRNVQRGSTSGFPLGFVRYDDSVSGNSYLQLDSGTITPFTFGNWDLGLRFVNDGRPVPPALQLPAP